jgi:hypothetical protein
MLVEHKTDADEVFSRAKQKLRYTEAYLSARWDTMRRRETH